MMLSEQGIANVGPRDLKDPGSPEWCWQTADLLKLYWSSIDKHFNEYDEMWESLVAHRAWEKIPQEEPFGSLEAMKEGLKVGSPEEGRARAAQLAIQAKPLPKHGGTNSHNKEEGTGPSLPPGSASAERLTARIARDHPEIHERMKAGEFKSPTEAARAAGILQAPPKRVGLISDVRRVAANIRKHYTPEQVDSLRKALQEDS